MKQETQQETGCAAGKADELEQGVAGGQRSVEIEGVNLIHRSKLGGWYLVDDLFHKP